MATLVLCLVNVATMHGTATHGPLPLIGPAPVGQLPLSLGQQVLAVAVVAPLALAARYPLLAWRILSKVAFADNADVVDACSFPSRRMMTGSGMPCW